MSFEPDEMMMQIFRSEVESHSESLTSSLLALEQDPSSTSALERMMRAAHSIKGAARIVRVNPAVDVAHVMEDCFVAAQKGKLKLTPDDVDILLRGVDLLVRISAATQNPDPDWGAFASSVEGIVSEVKRSLEGRPSGASQAVRAPASQPSEPLQHSEAVRDQPAASVITCPEFLDAQAADHARRQMLSALDGGANEIRLDLGSTRDLDAIGLAFLAAARQFVATRPRTTLRFEPVSSDMRAVLQFTGLDASASGATL